MKQAIFKRILHANDGSPSAFNALALALDIAVKDGSELHMVSVGELPQFPEIIGEVINHKEAADRQFRDTLKRAKKMAKDRDIELQHHLLTGHPVASIVDLVRDIGASLLVIGATGHHELYERMIGSRAERLVQLAPCPVLVVK